MTPFPNTGFLAEASDRLRTMLSAQATEISLTQGDVLFEQGDEGDALYAILEGTLEVSFLAMSGRKLSLTLMKPGEVFGEIGLFDNGPRTATIAAAEPSRVLRVRRKDVMNQIRQHPDLAVDMIRLAGLRMRWMGSQLNEQVFLPMPIRLARKLLHLSDLQGDASNRITLSQSELAEFVGATREAVSKTISTWKRDKVVEASRGGLKIHDFDALRELADSDLI
ncbi:MULTISPECIES: Crp/Fnr family transcriptional regulator [Ruegeria]|jgi:CRP-like cAMP-binding protein|uniref:Crp/Fnr family transcriptional regulator n=1 Tax=Ruegeria TaxID=97050 RepID=UPI00147A0BA3|nr:MULTISPECIES: Crp/Fnr family transcriptional regulator [Ruegeria]MBO9412892.1 Crp/Fnr family transcriptional regulator [Ruegeria sp. R8_1]MBO9416561.1 Crp/Fnr family transcriptional regulator [Ruegeria sp. R8_2]